MRGRLGGLLRRHDLGGRRIVDLHFRLIEHLGHLDELSDLFEGLHRLDDLEHLGGLFELFGDLHQILRRFERLGGLFDLTGSGELLGGLLELFRDLEDLRRFLDQGLDRHVGKDLVVRDRRSRLLGGC